MDAGTFTNWASQNADILRNLANNLLPVQTLLKGAAYVLGLTFAFKALYSLKVYGEQRTMMSSQTSVKEPLTYLFVSAVFLFLPTVMKMFLTSSFGSPNILAYAPINSSNKTMNALFGSQSEVGHSIALIIQTIGFVAFIRGWVMVARAASQGGGQQTTTGKGLMHVFGGILAINVVSTLQIVNNTLYGT